MILAKKYKTREGAAKRAAFENAHLTIGNRNMRYAVVRFVCGQRADPSLISPPVNSQFVHWQIEKVKAYK